MQGLLYLNGFKVGNLEVLSMMGLSEKSKQLQTSVSELKQMRDISFPEATEQIESATEELKVQKQQYASLVGGSSETELTSAVQTQKYEVEYLWVKLGNHATKNGITLKMDIARGAASENKIYNLNFTATGSYANITALIYEIENDSTLGFKIENFKLLPSTIANNKNDDKNNEDNENNTTKSNNTSTTVVDVTNLVATFTVRDVYIDLDQISTTTQNNTNNVDKEETNKNETSITENTIIETENTVE